MKQTDDTLADTRNSVGSCALTACSETVFSSWRVATTGRHASHPQDTTPAYPASMCAKGHRRAHTGRAAIPVHMRAKNVRAAVPGKLPLNAQSCTTKLQDLKACQAIKTHRRIPSLETGPTSKCAPTVRAQRPMRAHTERAHARKKKRAQLIPASCR